MIKQGYMVQITSWENDGDCYNTKTFDGLSQMQTISLVAFCEFLQEYGSEQPSASDIDFSKFVQFNDYAGFSGWDSEASQEYFEELAYEVVGCGYETEYLRVLESYKVYNVPADMQEIKF